MRWFILMAALFLSACNIMTSTNGNYTQTVSSWRWAKSSALVKSWGRPTQITLLPNGNRAYLYHKESYKTYPAPAVTSTYSAVSVENGNNVVIAPSTNQTPPPNAT